MTWRVWLVMVMLGASGARAEDLTRDARNALLKDGAIAVGGSAVAAGILAGIGASLTSKGCYESQDQDGHTTTWCGDGTGAWRGAAAGAVIGYEIFSMLAIPTAYIQRGRTLGLRGHARMVRSAVVASSIGALTLTLWSMEQLSDRGTRAAVGLAGGLATVAAPWGFGYLAYRGSHRRKRGPVVMPLITPTSLGVRGRF